MSQERKNILKKILIASGIGLGILVALIAGNNYTDPDVQLHKYRFTQHEYNILKPELVSVMKNRHSKKPTFDQVQMWFDMVKREGAQCGTRIIMTDATEENVVDKINEFIELNCL